MSNWIDDLENYGKNAIVANTQVEIETRLGAVKYQIGGDTAGQSTITKIINFLFDPHVKIDIGGNQINLT